MLRKIAAVARKEFHHILHDRFTLALTLGLPIAQLVFYGYALETRIRGVPTALLNRDSHIAGRLLQRQIERSSLFAVKPCCRSQADVASALRTGAIRLAIEIPANYTADLMYSRKTAIRVWVDGADVATSNYLLSALDTIGFNGTRDLLLPASRQPPEIRMEPAVMFNPEGRTAAFLIPGLIAILAQTITTLLMALSVTTEREKRTLEQMLVTPIGPTAIILGKSLTVASIGLVECGFLILVMRSLFSIPIEGSLNLLAAIVPLLVLAPVGMGLLIASAARNQLQALQFANVVLLPSVMLSGFVIPREFLRFPWDSLSKLLPSTYLVSLTRGVILRGTSIEEAAPEIARACAFGLVLLAAGFLSLRRSLVRRA